MKIRQQTGDFTRWMDRLASERRQALIRGLISVVAAAAIFMFLLLRILYLLWGGLRLFPIFSFVLFWAGIAAALAAVFVPRYFRPAGRRKLAAILDRKTGSYRSLIRSAEEFSRGGGDYSPYLIARTIQRAAGSLDQLHRRKPFIREGRPGWTALAVLLCIPMILLAVFAPAGTADLAAMITDPGISFRSGGKSNILVRPGDIQVLEGTPLQVEGIQFGSVKGEVYLRTRAADGIWREQSLSPDTVTAAGLPMVVYRRRFEDPGSGFEYYFISAGGASDTSRVDVILRPVINRIGAELSYPEYTGMDKQDIDMLAGRLSALRGTGITVEGEASKVLSGGKILFRSGREMPLKTSGSSFRVSFVVSGNDTFSIQVADTLGYSSRRRVTYPLEAREDLPPSVEVEYPPSGEYLPRSMLVDLHYSADDDFALSEVNLLYRKDGREMDFREQELFRPGRTQVDELEESYSWSLEGIDIMPGDRVLYYLEARDNNTLTGPGYSRTETRHLLVPSLSQMYAQYREQEQNRRSGIADIYEQGEEIREKLRELSLKFKSEGEMNWAKKKEGEELVRKYRQLQEKASEVVSNFEKSLNTLQQNRMTSMEIGKKLEQIRDLLSRIENQKLAEMIERMNSMMNELSEQEINSAMDQAETSMEEIMRSMDRAIQYLRDIMREEQMEALMRRMEDMLDKQKRLRDSSRTGDLSELSENQKKLGEEAEDFEKQLSDFMKKNQEGLEELSDRAGSSNLDSLMMEAAGQMSREKRDSAACTQNKTVGEMLNLYTCMGSCQLNMSTQMDERMMEAVERAAGELIQASMIQEEVLTGFGKGRSHRELIDRQLVVKGAVRRVTDNLYSAFSGAAFSLRNVFLQLGSVSASIDRVLSASENMRDPGERTYAQRAMTGINRAVMEMLKASSSQSGSGGGMKKKMTGMMKQQFSIDNSLREMYMNGNRAGLSMEERARMARMAARQRRLEELMKQMEEESGRTDDLLGDISGLSEEMDSVAAAMERGRLDSDLMDRENRILSRMLQAQRSINRRDYKRERSSRSSDFVWGREKEVYDADRKEEEELLRMIREAMREKGPREYRELIKLYFRALSDRVREGGE